MRIVWQLITLLLTAAACSPDISKVVIDYDNEAEFSEYDTYFWSDEFLQNQTNQPIYYNSLVKKRIKTAVESEMNGRGYRLDSISPDLLINSHMVVDERTEVRSSPSVYGYGFYGMDNIRSVNYTEGTLVIDIIDRSDKQLVWQGYYTGKILEATKPEEKSQAIRDAVSLIFQKYRYRSDQDQ
jgi:hypothetical protein